MAILRVIHLPLREGKVGVGVETRNLKVLGEERPESCFRFAEIIKMIGYHQHIKGDDNDECNQGKEPFFFLILNILFIL